MIYIYNYIKLYIHIISIHPFIHLSIYQSTLVVSWCALRCPVVSVKVVPLGSGHVFQWKGWPSGSRRHWSSGIRVAKICKMLIRTSDQTVWPNLWKAPGDLKPGLRESSHVLIGGCHPLLQLDQTGLNLLVLTHTHTPSYKPTFETQKNQATTTARFEFSTSPLRRTLKYLCSHCVQPTCTQTGYIRCLDLVYWVHKNLPLLCNEIACPPLAQVSMAATGALVASGSDDNSISLYASWPPSDAECFCWLRKKPGMFLNLLEGSTWSTNMHWSRRNYLNLSDYGILLWY